MKNISINILKSDIRSYFGFSKSPHIIPEEEEIILKICTNNFKTTKIYHGHCHGCQTASLNIDWCKSCFCYEDSNGIKHNWHNGNDNFISNDKKYGSEENIINEVKEKFEVIIKEKYPEYFI